MMLKKNEAMTHAGRFHADDVFCAALLKILNPQIHIVRQNSIPEGYTGLVFDLEGGKYDHHGERAVYRENCVRYASFGLLWKEYGTCLVSEKMAKAFDESFVQPLDQQDNNGGNNLLCRAITQANPKWDEKDSDPDTCFFQAVEFAKYILENEIKSMHSAERAEKTVLECLHKAKNGIVILPKGMPWKALLIPEEVYYVVYPSPRGGFNAQAVPARTDSQQCKVPFPEEWRGKRGELDLLTGLRGLIFCHEHGYLLGACSEEAAEKACVLSLERQKHMLKSESDVSM